jgi:NADH-quinone oxidoreductase subunit B
MREGLNLPEYYISPEMEGTVAITTLDRIYNWGRRYSVWPMFFGLACCAIEMIATAGARFDMARFGMEIMRPSPRQCDLMIVSGTVTKKMVPQVVRLYNQIPEPKYVLAMGACASGGGPFKRGYNVVAGIDKFLPVDVYVQVRWYSDEPDEGIPVPILGPDLIDLRDFPALLKKEQEKENQA